MGVTVAPDLPDLLVGALLLVTAFVLSGVEVAIGTIVQRATGVNSGAVVSNLLRCRYLIWQDLIAWPIWAFAECQTTDRFRL